MQTDQVKAIRRWRRGRSTWPSGIHIFFISLLAADLIQAIGKLQRNKIKSKCLFLLGSILDLKWVHLAVRKALTTCLKKSHHSVGCCRRADLHSPSHLKKYRRRWGCSFVSLPAALAHNAYQLFSEPWFVLFFSNLASLI